MKLIIGTTYLGTEITEGINYYDIYPISIQALVLWYKYTYTVSIIVLSRYYFYKVIFPNHMVLGDYFDKHFQ